MIVLVTGASGGFGSVLGETLAGQGMTVYGTSRQLPGRGGEHPFEMLRMDVSVPGSVEACVRDVVAREGRIDVLVNCVNAMIIGSFEEQTVDEVRALYETNVFGVIEICQQVIPVMRRQGGGTIVNMSSLGGLLAVPYMSAYTSAKFALEALSEALYHEVASDGIDVVIMQPVAMAMDRPATGAHLHVVARAEAGSPSHRMVTRMARDTAASRLTPEMVAKRVAQVITLDGKPLRVPMDKAKPLTLLKRLAPQFVIDRLVRGLTQGGPAEDAASS